jgi:putative sterol carrier protein
VRYLSDEWISAVADEIAGDAALADAARSHSVAVTQVVNATPFGDVAYHLVCRDAKVTFGKGAVPSDVTFTQHYETAVDVALARVNAADAFISGKVRFAGDHEKVIAAQPFFAALDAVFARVRARTQFE